MTISLRQSECKTVTCFSRFRIKPSSVVTTKFGIPETMNGVGKRPLKFESAKNRWPINLVGYRVRARRFCATADECAVCLAGNKVLSQDLEQVHPSPGDKNLPSAAAVATCSCVCVCPCHCHTAVCRAGAKGPES